MKEVHIPIRQHVSKRRASRQPLCSPSNAKRVTLSNNIAHKAIKRAGWRLLRSPVGTLYAE